MQTQFKTMTLILFLAMTTGWGAKGSDLAYLSNQVHLARLAGDRQQAHELEDQNLALRNPQPLEDGVNQIFSGESSTEEQHENWVVTIHPHSTTTPAGTSTPALTRDYNGVSCSFSEDNIVSGLAADQHTPVMTKDEANDLYIVYEDWSQGLAKLVVRKSTNGGESWFDVVDVAHQTSDLVSPDLYVNNGSVWLVISMVDSGQIWCYRYNIAGGDSHFRQISLDTQQAYRGRITSDANIYTSDQYIYVLYHTSEAKYFLRRSTNPDTPDFSFDSAIQTSGNWENVSGDMDIACGLGGKLHIVYKREGDLERIIHRSMNINDWADGVQPPLEIDNGDSYYYLNLSASKQSYSLLVSYTRQSAADGDYDAVAATSIDMGVNWETTTMGSTNGTQSQTNNYADYFGTLGEDDFYMSWTSNGAVMYDRSGPGPNSWSGACQASDNAEAYDGGAVAVTGVDVNGVKSGVVAWSGYRSGTGYDILASTNDPEDWVGYTHWASVEIVDGQDTDNDGWLDYWSFRCDADLDPNDFGTRMSNIYIRDEFGNVHVPFYPFPVTETGPDDAVLIGPLSADDVGMSAPGMVMFTLTLGNGIPGQQDYEIMVEVDMSTLTSTEEVAGSLPDDLTLMGNYPNPFNPSTTINYAIAEAGQVSLQLYDLKGTLVRTLVRSNLSAGRYSTQWHGHDNIGNPVVSGIYLARLQQQGEVRTTRMLYLK